MPATKPNPAEQSRRVVRACFSNNIEFYGVDPDKLAVQLGIAPRTLRNKLERPETFTLSELQKACKILKFTPLQTISILSGRPLTNKEIREFIMM